MGGRTKFVIASWVAVASFLIFCGDLEGAGIWISVPVMVSSWVYGIRGAAAATVLALPVHLLCMSLGGHWGVIDASMFIGHFFTAGVAFMLGWSRTLRERPERETELRIAQEQARAQVEIEAKMLRADRLATVGTMAAGVAHEVNNPLTYLLGNLELVKIQLDDLRAAQAAGEPASVEELDEVLVGLGEVDDGAQRITQIMRELKLFVRERGDELFWQARSAGDDRRREELYRRLLSEAYATKWYRIAVRAVGED